MAKLPSILLRRNAFWAVLLSIGQAAATMLSALQAGNTITAVGCSVGAGALMAVATGTSVGISAGTSVATTLLDPFELLSLTVVVVSLGD